MKILAHTSFMGTTGYANHARSFFCALNKYHTVKVRNLTIGDTWKGINNRPHDKEPYITQEMKDMMILQTLFNNDGSRSDYPIYDYKGNFKPDVHIILQDMDNHYFYDEYDGYKIAFNVYESTRYPDNFFKQLIKFDEVWVPTQWQFDSIVEQGCPIEKVRLITEGVDIDTFKPTEKQPKKDKFRFLLFGRWDYRKSTTEIIRTFGETFKGNNNVEMLCSVENPYPSDETRSTIDRIKKYDVDYPNVKYLNFPSRKDYIKYLQEGDVFVSCARSEGWNLPLCFPEGKIVFCNDSFINIENVNKDDNVISHKGKSQRVLDTYKRLYNDDLIKITLYNDIDFLELTPEHPVYCIKRNEFITKKGKFENIINITPNWIKSKDIEKGDIIIRTTIPQKYSHNEIIDLILLDETLKYNDEYVWYNTGYNQNSELKKYNRFVNLWDLSFLFGWYIAEGCDGKNKLIFTLNNNKEVDVANKIISEIYKIFGVNGNFRIKENTIIVSFNSIILCKFFTHFCGKMSHNKKIPGDILLGPLNILEELVKNMSLGDGHFSDNGDIQYTTVSKKLSRQLIFANQRLGIKSRIQKTIRQNRINRECFIVSWNLNNENGRHSNKSWWHPEGLGILVKKVDKTPYNGYVYNLEVENDNSYLMSNATVHNCEAMSCGTPSIYSNWGGQLQFAGNKGIPVKIDYIRSANIGDKEVGGEYCEPDFEDLSKQMLDAYNNYEKHKIQSLKESFLIHKEFNWDKVGKDASDILEKKEKEFVFVTTGNLGYMPVIEKMVKSLNDFSKSKVIVYGVDCDVPFDYPNLIKKRINPPKYSEHDKWYWKQYACIESLNEEYENFIWLDGDVVVNHNIDTISKYFPQIENYPLPDIHIQEEFYTVYEEDGETKTQLFNERLCDLWNVKFSHPMMHICMYVYNKKCGWWFEEIIKEYNSIDLSRYKTFFHWNDEGIDNALRWKYGFKKHLPVSNFDTSSYDGEFGYTNSSLQHFYRFWNEEGPQNFNRIYGWQFIPKDKSNIIYFHGNKDTETSEKMINFIKFKRDNSFYQSHSFYTEPNEVTNLGEIWGVEGGTMDIANKYGWKYAVYHEIYNLMDYYNNRIKIINDGDVVVDVGANMGVFNRWAYTQGASKVISFEPDKRYYKLLKLNADPRSILFNAAISNEIGTIELHESSHFGGSNIFWTPDNYQGYPVRTYTLDYLFKTKLIDHIDFLKVDIEGAEILAFKGISDENLMKVRNISMEYHHSHLNYNEELRANLITRLNNLGFNSHIIFLGDNNSLQMIYFTR